MTETINLNIQPQASVYALFSRLNYTEWNALAEFVDNSTQSFYAHQEDLETSNFGKLTITIDYDAATDSIKIEDDAFGMELADFKRAILLDAKPAVVNRNEFGFGLKTAATWFGDSWSAKSTQLGSTKCYEASIDIKELASTKKNDTDIHVTEAGSFEHYTVITIRKLNRRLNTQKIKKNIVALLNSMYRRDLKKGNIVIIYNGITLSFNDYPILNFRGVDWKKDIEISFDYGSKTYHAKGFVGIMEPGGYEKTGFALFRHDRAIVCNFKPGEIFGSQPQTQISLKLFGEIDMDDFEVNQAKDGFSWDSELQELFVKNLKAAIEDYIEVAKLSKKERAEEENKSPDDPPDKKEPQPEPKRPASPSTPHGEPKGDAPEKEEPPAVPTDNGTITLSFESTTYAIEYTNELSNDFLYNLQDRKLLINRKHEFIKSLGNGGNNTVVAKMVLAYVLAEEKAKKTVNNLGLISAGTMHNYFNSILGKIK